MELYLHKPHDQINIKPLYLNHFCLQWIRLTGFSNRNRTSKILFILVEISFLATEVHGAVLQAFFPQLTMKNHKTWVKKKGLLTRIGE